jgi:hypothetical protein
VDAVKEVVGISIGSSKRDHEVEIELLGERFRIRREGTDGDMEAAARRFAELDGTVDAFGLGGTDLFMRAAGHDYYLRDIKRLVAGVHETPVVCGTGLKGAVEASTIRFMIDELGLELAGKRCLVPSTVDRYGLAEALKNAGCEMTYGDLLFTLGIPVMIHRWSTLNALVRTIAPIASQLPFEWLYPTGEKQDEQPSKPGHERLYRDTDIVAGDFHYVRMYMPPSVDGLWIVTNTTTAEDIEDMRDRGVELLVTSTPRLEGRSFGTNVIEATLVALKGAKGPLSEADYVDLLAQVGFRPDVTWLNRGGSLS